jgi:hypothetical protein
MVNVPKFWPKKAMIDIAITPTLAKAKTASAARRLLRFLMKSGVGVSFIFTASGGVTGAGALVGASPAASCGMSLISSAKKESSCVQRHRGSFAGWPKKSWKGQLEEAN